MDTLLKDGQHLKNLQGYPVKITGRQRLAQSAFIRLTVPKGSFLYDKELGSRFFQLRASTNKDQLNRTALSYAQEAVFPIKQAKVDWAECSFSALDTVNIRVGITIEKENFVMEVNQSGTI